MVVVLERVIWRLVRIVNRFRDGSLALPAENQTDILDLPAVSADYSANGAASAIESPLTERGKKRKD